MDWPTLNRGFFDQLEQLEASLLAAEGFVEVFGVPLRTTLLKWPSSADFILRDFQEACDCLLTCQ